MFAADRVVHERSVLGNGRGIKKQFAALRSVATGARSRWWHPVAFGALFFGLMVSDPARSTPVPDTLAQRLKPCTVCHGVAGQSIAGAYAPRIAGKPAGYLFHQLQYFRDGWRQYREMNELLADLSDAYLREIAEYYAAQHPPYPKPAAVVATAGVLSLGEQLVRRGDPAHHIPACQSCHGKRLTGRFPAIPSLIGLPRDYIVGQLGEWVSAARAALPPDCMAQIARRLTNVQIAAISAWLATQPIPKDTRPASMPAQRLPMRCGSVIASSPRAQPARTDANETGLIARGRYLARIGGCGECHTSRGGIPYAGGRGVETPFGTVFAPNLTPDPVTGIGAWSVKQFWHALHLGIGRDGEPLYPAFPYPRYTRIRREDADAIFAYLRSLPPVHALTRAPQLRFPYDQRALLWVWRGLFFTPDVFRPEPERSAQWNRGAYLVQGLGHCAACHAPRNVLGAVTGARSLGGGRIPMLGWYAPPLVGLVEERLAQRGASEIAALVRNGVSTHDAAFGPMAEVIYGGLQALSERDARAIAVYLQSLSPMPPVMAERLPANAPVLAEGADIYRHECADCHKADGHGVANVYPALADSPAVRAADPINLVRIVLDGGYPPSTPANPRPYGMPPYFAQLNDVQIAAVLSYIRASWGNAAPPVDSFAVARIRAAYP